MYFSSYPSSFLPQLVEETKPPRVVTVIEETDKVPAYMVVLVILFGVRMCHSLVLMNPSCAHTHTPHTQ